MIKQISLKKRLKLFDAYVTPCAMYGLGAMSISQSGLEQLAVCQRKMLRLMIGWSYAEKESWQERGHRMKIKVQNTIRIYDVQLWNRTVLRRKWNWACRVACMSSSRWSRQIAYFDPAIHMQTSQSHIKKKRKKRGDQDYNSIIILKIFHGSMASIIKLVFYANTQIHRISL